MKQGIFFDVPGGRADLEQLWATARPVNPAAAPSWMRGDSLNHYRHVTSASGAALAGDQQAQFLAELKDLQDGGLIVAEDETQPGQYHVYVTAPQLPYFVDEHHQQQIGAEALAKVRTQSDVRYLRGAQGVIEVDRQRWAEAQNYERSSWMSPAGLRQLEDRNSQHERSFDDYRALQGRQFANAIEIGCGPFTNIVRILKRIQRPNVTLLDPLMNEYLTHPNCTYRGQQFREHPATRVRTLAQPAEDLVTNEKFDLVVMINVLEHCFSVPRIFERILSLTAPQGTLVFHDKYLPASAIENFVQTSYDAGHPLHVSEPVIWGFLSQRYDQLYCKFVSIPIEVCTFDAAYFIGQKRC